MTIIMSSGGRVRARRLALSLTQVELAQRTGLSRQALGAIESDLYQPSVGAALSLAHELGETVERLFGESDLEAQRVNARWYEDTSLGTAPNTARAALGRINGRIVAMPQRVAALALNPASGVVTKLKGNRAEIATYNSSEEIDSALLVAGCDPSVTLLADWMTRHRCPARLVPISCSSSRALAALADGCAHTAGVHLKDNRDSTYNVESARRALKSRSAIIVTFARWELGIAVAAGNPRRISSFADLAQPRLRIANRDSGSGARAVLEAGLRAAGIDRDRIEGYDSELPGHLEVAGAIALGHADAGVTLRVAADAYGLDFVPVQEERYDLVIMASLANSPSVKAMLDTLNSGRFAREISQFCGYDTSPMGNVVARLNMESSAGA